MKYQTLNAIAVGYAVILNDMYGTPYLSKINAFVDETAKKLNSTEHEVKLAKFNAANKFGVVITK